MSNFATITQYSSFILAIPAVLIMYRTVIGICKRSGRETNVVSSKSSCPEANPVSCRNEFSRRFFFVWHDHSPGSYRKLNKTKSVY
uniref:Putative secreted protein n=1 Tax=Panstrongylus lignarius TaxID=156445 RepID=A0A224Y2Q2_9HEMI